MVSNASPLIYLSLVRNLHLLKRLFGDIVIPAEVYREVCQAKDTPDSIVISTAVDDGWIHIQKGRRKDTALLAKSSGIDTGEAAAILIAKEERALLLIDDKMGRSAAEILGVKCIGTIGVLLHSLFDSILDFNEFVENLDTMIDFGFRVDSKVYRMAIRLARNFGEK